MNSKLFKKKSAFAFLAVFVIVIIGCVFLNIFLVKPAIAKINEEKADSSVTNDAGQEVNVLEKKKTDDGFVYYILTDDNNQAYVVITSYDGDEKNVTIPDSIENCPVKEIGDSCFNYNDIVESITIPDSVEKIGSFTFCSCKNLKKVVIPSSVKSIGSAINSGSNFTIFGESGSYAEEYTRNPEKYLCEDNPIPFKAINSNDK